MKVLILHTVPPDIVVAGDIQGRVVGEFDLGHAALNVADALPDAIIAGVRGEVGEVMTLLEHHDPDVVFNICEAPQGRPDLEAQLAAVLELVGVRFTGSGSATLALCRRKDRTDAVLAAAGVPVPRTGVFPCIVKPADEDGSAGIFANSVCDTPEALAVARKRLAGRQIVQEFLPGREFVVALWGRESPDYFSIGETRFLNGLSLITYEAKWDVESAAFADSPLDYNMPLGPVLRDALVAAAQGAWRAVEARGYIRVDIRLDGFQSPFVIDVNPNPELGPGVGICRAVQEAGWTWERFVRQQVEWA